MNKPLVLKMRLTGAAFAGVQKVFSIVRASQQMPGSF